MFSDYTVSAEVTEDGRLELSDRDAFSKAMRHFKRGPVTVRIQVDRGKRTSQANRYYRLILGLIADDTGDDPDDLHEFFKRKFLTAEIRNVLGEEVEVWTTVDKDPETFHRYVEDIRRFALIERGIETPDPDPALRGKSRHAKREAA
jgi:hypothetical protein